MNHFKQQNIEGKSDTQCGHWDGKVPKFLNLLRVWGKAGAVKLKTRMDTKVYDRGFICMFVGYSTSHADDTYFMWDPISRRVR
jgi:hypothetical protein